MNILEEKIRWFFKNVKKELVLDDLELLKLGFFDNDHNVVFRKDIIRWRKINENWYMENVKEKDGS